MFPIPLWVGERVIIGHVVGFFICQLLANQTTTVCLHRSFAHKSVQLTPPVRFAFHVVIWMTTGIRPGEWVAEHRVHHKHADEVGDPHSPYISGIKQVVQNHGQR